MGKLASQNDIRFVRSQVFVLLFALCCLPLVAHAEGSSFGYDDEHGADNIPSFIESSTENVSLDDSLDDRFTSGIEKETRNPTPKEIFKPEQQLDGEIAGNREAFKPLPRMTKAPPVKRLWAETKTKTTTRNKTVAKRSQVSREKFKPRKRSVASRSLRRPQGLRKSKRTTAKIRPTARKSQASAASRI
jgi:hypothetical protein